MKIYTTTDSTAVEFTRALGSTNIDREWYEEDLKRRQKEHLDNVRRGQDNQWQPCLHDGCPECLGTGIKRDGSMCIHNISCPCPKCSPRC